MAAIKLLGRQSMIKGNVTYAQYTNGPEPQIGDLFSRMSLNANNWSATSKGLAKIRLTGSNGENYNVIIPLANLHGYYNVLQVYPVTYDPKVDVYHNAYPTYEYAYIRAFVDPSPKWQNALIQLMLAGNWNNGETYEYWRDTANIGYGQYNYAWGPDNKGLIKQQVQFSVV